MIADRTRIMSRRLWRDSEGVREVSATIAYVY